MTWVRSASWQPRLQTAARSYADSAAFVTGARVRHVGSPGMTWFTGHIPIVLDHDNLTLTVTGNLTGGRIGIEWRHARRAKFHPIVWTSPAPDGSFQLQDIPAIRTTASFRLVVEVGTSGSAMLEITECYGKSVPTISVRVNQVGYNIGHPKTFVVEANGPAGSDAFRGPATFRVVAPTDTLRILSPPNPEHEFATMLEGDLKPAGFNALWGRSYWRGDFTGLDLPNDYYVEARVGQCRAESPTFTVDTDVVTKRTFGPAHRFFWYQRCGTAVVGWHDPCHLDDRVFLPNGEQADVSGGWHDAGDYNKYNGFTPLATYSLLYAHERTPAHHGPLPSGPDHDILDEALWGARFLRKMQCREDGGMWGQVFDGYAYWGPPEDHTDNLPGTDDDRIADGESRSLWLVAAFARLGRVVGEDYLDRALAHWELAYDSTSAALPHVAQALMAAHELGQATGDSAFAAVAVKCARQIVACQGSDRRYDGWFAGSPGGGPRHDVIGNGLPAAALAFWARENPSHPFRASAETSLRRYVGFVTGLADSSFGVSRFYDGSDVAYFRPFERAGDWHVGQNSQYLSEAWAAFLTYQVIGDESALVYGLDQVDWVLGVNPFGVSMMQGQGSRNVPAGHHGYSTIPGRSSGLPPGSVLNGIVRFDARTDLPLLDLVEQGIARYQTNEPWLPHNAYYLLAMTELSAICRAQAAE